MVIRTTYLSPWQPPRFRPLAGGRDNIPRGSGVEEGGPIDKIGTIIVLVSPPGPVDAGEEVTLTAARTGGSAPLTYPWYAPGNVLIPGATGSRYTFTAQEGDSGTYTCVVTGAGATDSPKSSGVAITVVVPWPASTMLLRLTTNKADTSVNGFVPTVADGVLSATNPPPISSTYHVFSSASDSGIRFADDPLLNPDDEDFTITAFVRPDANQVAYPAWFSKGSFLSQPGAFCFFREASIAAYGMGFAASTAPIVGSWVESIRTGGTAPVDQWWRLTVVRRGDTITLYGGPDVIGTVDATTLPPLTTTHPFVVGGDLPDTFENWTGGLCDFVYIKGTALTPTQITYLQTNPYP